MTEQTPTAAQPQFYEETAVGLTTRQDPNKDKTRYVFSIGDHIPDDEKRQFESVNAFFGGMWVGHSEIAGAPTMRRTHYMLYRGAITPLETTAIPRKADHRPVERSQISYLEGKNVPPNIPGYTVYAGDDLNFLQNDNFRPMGVVELQPLRYKTWEQSNARQLQLLLFPRWNDWLMGAKAPNLLDDWVNEVMQSFNRHPELRVFENDIFESQRLFRSYALNHIEQNRQVIMAKRNVDTGGMYIGWNNRSRLYAAQLGVTLEQEDQLRPAAQTTATGDSALIREMQEERKLRQQEAEQHRQLIQMLASMLQQQNGGKPVPYVEEFTAPQAVEVSIEPEQDPSEQDLSKNVSFGTAAVEDTSEVTLSTPTPEVVDPEQTEERKEFEKALDDPNFARAVEGDEGLRGQIKNHPNLVGAIEQE